jgi:pimeloyl-ACP methyl ester carboxylesterase
MVCDQNLITEEVIARFHALKKADGFDYAQISAPRHFEKWEAYREDLKKITQPTLILWGEKDRYLSPKEGVRLCETIQNSRLVLIPDAGHLPMWERPAEVNREIGAFL